MPSAKKSKSKSRNTSTFNKTKCRFCREKCLGENVCKKCRDTNHHYKLELIEDAMEKGKISEGEYLEKCKKLKEEKDLEELAKEITTFDTCNPTITRNPTITQMREVAYMKEVYDRIITRANQENSILMSNIPSFIEFTGELFNNIYCCQQELSGVRNPWRLVNFRPDVWEEDLWENYENTIRRPELRNFDLKRENIEAGLIEAVLDSEKLRINLIFGFFDGTNGLDGRPRLITFKFMEILWEVNGEVVVRAL